LRICIVVPYDFEEQGGVKRHAENLARALRAGGDEVTIAAASSRPQTESGVVGFGGIVNLPNNGSENRLALLTSPRKIRRFFREQRFDVVHVMEPLVPFLSAWALVLSPESAHVGTFHAFSEKENLFSRVCRACGGPLILPKVHRGIAVSPPAERYARPQWKQRDLALIPNGVCTETFRGPPPDEAEGRPVRLLFVGHWRDRRKGLSDLLSAFEQLRSQGGAFTLDVVGAGPSGVQPPQVDGVTFHGPVRDDHALAQHYRRCDIFVAPSLGFESFGIVLLEAMAAARPIVCTNIEGYSQVVSEENAHLVMPGDVPALAAAIAELAQNPVARRRMGEANRRRAEAYDWSQIAHRVREEYVLAMALRFGVEVAQLHERNAVPEPIRRTGSRRAALT
jgi:phosphatidyl-myo-inositol alpha-mannosyltransferase